MGRLGIVVIEIPRCAATATAPLPFVVLGHGLFGNAKDTRADPRLLAIADQLCMVLIGTDGIGTSSAHIGIIGRYVLPDLNKIDLITDHPDGLVEGTCGGPCDFPP